jgi:hypothetical protein
MACFISMIQLIASMSRDGNLTDVQRRYEKRGINHEGTAGKSSTQCTSGTRNDHHAIGYFNRTVLRLAICATAGVAAELIVIEDFDATSFSSQLS